LTQQSALPACGPRSDFGHLGHSKNLLIDRILRWSHPHWVVLSDGD